MSQIHFEKLTPVKDVDLRIYNDALNFVFENNDIRNVAVSGAYSAGKSSVIESYKEKHKELSFLHISLANFETTEQQSIEDKNNNASSNDTETDAKKDSDNSVVKELVLEGKILNQLLHQIDVSKIPQTNFRVKQKISEESIFRITLKSIIFIIFALHICFFSKWCNFVSSLMQFKFLNFLQITTKSISLLFSGFIIFRIACIAIYNLIKIQKNKSIFKGLKFQGNEIEIFEKSDESYFDKYLNEVLYLFDNADADVIVFEDMDRYNINQIFQRLREINGLINLNRTKEDKDPLRFFYLIRDDIFVSKDRTKFFDFIIPVVPVIDSSNSYDQFISHFRKGGVLEKFDQHFLQGVSLYIDDMRILKNIYNEFMVYYNKIGTTEQDYNELLAIIIYKNIFPRDFSDTQINVGFVSTLFNNQKEIIEDNINRIDEKIQELKEKIDLCNKEHLRNVNEVGMIYWKNNDYGTRIPNVSSPEYVKRKEIVDIIKNNQIGDLKNQITDLELKKSELKNKKIRELITRENVDTVFNICYKNFLGEKNDFKEMKSSQYFDLIKYLIWNGYIDETYEDYMTYFYPNSLTINDKKFLRSITDKKAKEWTYRINNPKLVLSRLREVDFREIETLNFFLFAYILDTERNNKKYLIIFINQLKEEKYFKFMKEYFSSAPSLILYVQSINKYWPSFLSEIINWYEFSYEQKKEYILITLYYCDNEIVDNINNDNFLSTTIASDPKFLEIKNPRVEKLIDEFSRLNIKFKCPDYEESDKDLFEAIYQHKLYEFTFENISLMLEHIFNIQNKDDIQHKNYSLIVEDPESKLFQYVNENIDQYMTIILENCGDTITDTPKAVQELINNEDIEISKRTKYVEFLQTQLELLQDIKDINFWDLFLQKGLIKYSETNILQYYFKSGKGLNDILINFINIGNKDFKLSLNEIDSKFGEKSASSLFDDVIICNSLIDDKYRNIIAELRYEYSNFCIKEISERKIKILIELRTIKMTAENVRFMRTTYQSQFIYFIEHNISEYINDVIEKEPISNDELLCILDLNIDDSFKINLISHTKKPISVISKNYSGNVKKYILQHNFNISELLPLIDNYEKQSDMIKEVLRELSEKYIGIIIKNHIELAIGLFEFLISKEDIPTENKLILLTANINKFSKSECEGYIKIIGSKEYEKIFTKGRPKFEVTEINKKLLDEFKSKNWISDFYEKDGVFKVRHRKLKSNLETSVL
ncbi:hypothetical protein [Clostridium coskatii]|uniref:YobI-like P-loop NTPase domain-containing protein n=1 Tax=Clostridium coskatii TaxID=1705578 RepID=A0A168MW85_9CLOT|nr:hypothetical protein [Clostridium coskatii]OAA85387.1 hypothetical protein WX73_03222 [Clostridium coskatii]OBR91361.1 hypothetical protein CLCOS_35100 [Clostridium coskatii]